MLASAATVCCCARWRQCQAQSRSARSSSPLCGTRSSASSPRRRALSGQCRRGAAWPMVAPPRWRRRCLAPALRPWSWAPTLCRAPYSPSGVLAASPPRCLRSLRRRTTCFARSSRFCSAWVASGGAPGALACSPLAPRPSRRPSTTREAAEAKEEAAACRVPWLWWRRLGSTPSTASAPPSTCAPTPPRRSTWRACAGWAPSPPASSPQTSPPAAPRRRHSAGSGTCGRRSGR
mmetsp:Transcript_11261/g.35606  ORF Transcript_11261/g.35606 Transcript_11261/m.35606 type:complete len:234 (-) Transcript_11261:569-1270(-)